MSETLYSAMTVSKDPQQRLHDWTSRFDSLPAHIKHASGKAFMFKNPETQQGIGGDIVSCMWVTEDDASRTLHRYSFQNGHTMIRGPARGKVLNVAQTAQFLDSHRASLKEDLTKTGTTVLTNATKLEKEAFPNLRNRGTETLHQITREQMEPIVEIDFSGDHWNKYTKEAPLTRITDFFEIPENQEAFERKVINDGFPNPEEYYDDHGRRTGKPPGWP